MKIWEKHQKGINLGGWVSQCVHTKEHYDSFIVESDIKRIADAGYDHVRCPFDYNLIQDKSGEFIIENFKYLDNVIEWCKKYNLNIILDLHKTYGFSFDPGEGEGSNFFTDEKLIVVFLKLWEEIARRYGDKPEFVAFELLNEVTDKEFMDNWMNICKRAVEVIRKYTKDTKILLGGYWHNAVSAVKDLAMPFDENIIYNFHCYEPLIFTHQNAHWVPASIGRFMKYPITRAEYLEAVKDLPDSFKFTANAMDEEGFNTNYFERLFKEAIDVANERNVMLYCGEYGVIDQADAESRENWLKDIRKVFDDNGIGNSVWSYKKMDFGIFEA